MLPPQQLTKRRTTDYQTPEEVADIELLERVRQVIHNVTSVRLVSAESSRLFVRVGGKLLRLRFDLHPSPVIAQANSKRSPRRGRS